MKVAGRRDGATPVDLECRVLRTGDPEIAVLSFTPSKNPRLTGAECEVALAVARGLSNAEIARERGASVRTVANQVAAILKKLGVSSRVELATRIKISDLF